jgi:hypothetical protein
LVLNTSNRRRCWFWTWDALVRKMWWQQVRKKANISTAMLWAQSAVPRMYHSCNSINYWMPGISCKPKKLVKSWIRKDLAANRCRNATRGGLQFRVNLFKSFKCTFIISFVCFFVWFVFRFSIFLICYVTQDMWICEKLKICEYVK